MNISGRITQIKSNVNGNAFLNVSENRGLNSISVWGSVYKTSTYLCFHNETTYQLILFEDKQTAKQYFEQNKDKFIKVIPLEELL